MTADPIAQQLGARGWESYTATCQHCGREFPAKRRTSGGGRPVLYCPGSCRKKAHAERKRKAQAGSSALVMPG